MMGRISLYEQSKLPSAVSGYRTSAAPEVAALENVSQSIGQLGQSYIAMKERTKTNVTSIEAQNAFNNFRADYAGVVADYDNKSKNAASTEIDGFKTKAYSARTSLTQKYSSGLSDEARKTYDAMVADFSERDGVGLEEWSVKAKYDSVGREGLASIGATATAAGGAANIQAFEAEMKKADEAIENYSKSYPVDKAKLIETTRQIGAKQFIANAIERDPNAAAAMLTMDNSPIMAYTTPAERQTFLAAAKKQSEAVAVSENFDNDAAAIATAHQLTSESGVSGSSYGALVAEYAFLPQGPQGDKLRMIHEAVFKGRDVQQAPDDVQENNHSELLQEAAAMYNANKARKVTRAQKTSGYLMLVGKAAEMRREGNISEKQFNEISKLATTNLKASVDGKQVSYANMLDKNDDPREYMLYRGLDDLAKNQTFKKMSKKEQRLVMTRYTTQLFDALDVRTKNDPKAYEDLQKEMFASGETKDSYYQLFATGVERKTKGSFSGFNLLSRAIYGDKYQDVYVDPKTNTSYPIVATSKTGATYGSYTKQFAKELETR